MCIVLILDHKETKAYGKSAENISAPLRLEKFQIHFHKGSNHLNLNYITRLQPRMLTFVAERKHLKCEVLSTTKIHCGDIIAAFLNNDFSSVLNIMICLP